MSRPRVMSDLPFIVPGPIIARGASALITDDRGYMLAVLRDDIPLWVNVGGYLDEGEEFIDALHREALEEVEAQLDVLSEVGDFYSPRGEGDFLHVRFYTARLKASTPAILGNEGTHLEWFAPDKLPANYHIRDRIRSQQALRGLSGVNYIHPEPDLYDFSRQLKAGDFYRLSEWKEHPRVIEKRHLGTLKYDPAE